MAKTRDLIDKDVAVSFNLSSVVVTEYIRAAVERCVQGAVDSAVNDAVSEAVQAQVDKIGRDRISKAIEQVLSDGWQKTNDYGENTGAKIGLKERIGKILTDRDRYSGNGVYIDELIKRQVQEALNKDLKADIQAARDRFKAEVDAVLTATIRDALAKNLGLKT